jgi:glutathione S-transferase
MTLTLYFHPLSSFCQKVLVALYEKGTPFERRIVDLGEETSRESFLKVWPIGKFPVLRDDGRGQTIAESTTIIEYLDRHYGGPVRLVPDDPDLAIEARRWDRFFDLHVNVPMQKIVTDRIRPEGKGDPFGVELARGQLRAACDIVEAQVAGKTWAVGEAFTMADCAAAPALFYACKVMSFGDGHQNVARYFERLTRRPSFARAVREAEPYFGLFPYR